MHSYVEHLQANGFNPNPIDTSNVVLSRDLQVIISMRWADDGIYISVSKGYLHEGYFMHA